MVQLVGGVAEEVVVMQLASGVAEGVCGRGACWSVCVDDEHFQASIAAATFSDPPMTKRLAGPRPKPPKAKGTVALENATAAVARSSRAKRKNKCELCDAAGPNLQDTYRGVWMIDRYEFGCG